MAFGPIMRMTVGELQVELAPFGRDDLPMLIAPGMQQGSVMKYLSRTTAPTLEGEYEWYDKVRSSDTQLVWGIWIVEGDTRTLIGNSSIMDIAKHPIYQGETGSVIVDKTYWGRGIASAIHRARTWYAFEQLGMCRLTSAVIQGNDASRRALEKVGYTYVWTARNEKFVDGSLRHMDHLECLNPADWAWRQWWHGDRPSTVSRRARSQTREVLEWAREHVELL